MNEKWGGVKALIKQISEGDTTDAFEPSLVLSDWFEERGFDSPADGFRSPPGSPSWLLALSMARALFGDHANKGQAGSYSAVFGLPKRYVRACEVVTVDTQPSLAVLVRRIFIPNDVADRISVREVRLGRHHQLLSTAPVPGSLFGASMPDLFRRVVLPNQILRMVVENNSNHEVDFQGAVLGDEVKIENIDPEEITP